MGAAEKLKEDNWWETMRTGETISILVRPARENTERTKTADSATKTENACISLGFEVLSSTEHEALQGTTKIYHWIILLKKL